MHHFVLLDMYMNSFICPKCGNKNIKYVGYKNGLPYCRLCISMKGETAKPHKVNRGMVVLSLNYGLSNDQKEISSRVVENYKKRINTLIYAVCGAGKTELVYEVMAYALSNGQNVGFAVPRRDVVIELFQRIKSAFPSNSVTAVYGGNTDRLEGDIVVLTTHQLYRYENYFDLLVMDEIDAFPFKHNQLLKSMYQRCLKGNSVLMSATPSNEVIAYYKKPGNEILELNTRFHKHPLPVPEVKIRYGMTKIPYLVKKLKEYRSQNKQTFVFAPTIEICEQVYILISKVLPEGKFVHSKCIDRNEIISDFKKQKYMYLITTAVLERGITVKNLQVIVFQADHDLYDEYALIQIAGRVGRKYDAPEGEVIFVASKETEAIKRAIDTIKSKNMYL